MEKEVKRNMTGRTKQRINNTDIVFNKKRPKPRTIIKRILVYAILCLLALTFIFPFLWLVSASLKNPGNALGEISYPGIALLPRNEAGEISFNIQNYIKAFDQLDIMTILSNTLIVAVTNTVLNTLFNSMAGYAFARIDFKGKNILFKIVLLGMMLPGTVMMVPNLIICNELGIYNTLWALILPFAMSIYNVFLMRQHFFSFSRELEEAAMIDGAGRLRTFLTIALPMASPMLVVTGVTTFMWNYNNYLWPLIATNSDETATLAIKLGSLIATSGTAQNYPIMLAGAVIVSAPMILLFFVCQKYIIGGISDGAVKE